MAKEIPDLVATARTGTGKGAARQARRENLVPGIVYGGGVDPLPINLPYNALIKKLKAGRFLSTLFNLKVEGQDDVRVIARSVRYKISSTSRRWSADSSSAPSMLACRTMSCSRARSARRINAFLIGAKFRWGTDSFAAGGRYVPLGSAASANRPSRTRRLCRFVSARIAFASAITSSA